MNATANTTTAKATTAAKAAPRKSYTLAAPLSRATHAIAKATTAAKATANRNVQNLILIAAAAVSSCTTGNTAAVALDAAAKADAAAATAAAIANTATANAAAAAAHELHMCALSLVGVFAYIDATLDSWVASRTDVTAAKFVRTKGKTPTLELVITTAANGTIHKSVNTTAALDFRKVDDAVDKAIAKRKAKATTTAAKAAKSRKAA